MKLRLTLGTLGTLLIIAVAMLQSFPAADESGPAAIYSRGTLHVMDLSGGGLAYSWSHDGGRTWRHASADLGGSAGVWDFRASAAFDEAVAVVKVEKGDGTDVVKAFRFTGLAGNPTLSQVLDVGDGDLAMRGAVTGGGTRFDFETVGFTPTGKIVTSFGDKAHPTAALAIEQ